MARLIYFTIASLDGYIEDADGRFDWAAPSDEVHSFVNDVARPVGTYLYGRRMYETMQVWETDPGFASGPPVAADFASIWQSAEKIVYSRTLPEVSTPGTRLEREFDADAVRALKAGATRDLAVGGATLAAHAIRAGLVDEYDLLIAPVIAGGGNPLLPGKVRVGLELVAERRFANGLVHVRYRAKR